MDINNAYNNNFAGMQQLQSAVMSSPETQTPPTPQSVASQATQARAQESEAATQASTQQRVQPREQAQSASTSPEATDSAYEQYQRTGRLDTYA